MGDGEPRKRYVLCLNPPEAEREPARRTQLFVELDAELALLEQREADHPKAACVLMASPRGRYLSSDGRGRARPGMAKVTTAAKFDDGTLSAQAIALGYKGAWIIGVLHPPDEADGPARAADASLDRAPDRGARQALRVGAADAAAR